LVKSAIPFTPLPETLSPAEGLFDPEHWQRLAGDLPKVVYTLSRACASLAYYQPAPIAGIRTLFSELETAGA
jgi:hypothetical protein